MKAGQVRAIILFAAASVAAAGCGGGGHSSSSTTGATTVTSEPATTAGGTTATTTGATTATTAGATTTATAAAGGSGTITLSGAITGTYTFNSFVVPCSGSSTGPSGQLVFEQGSSTVSVVFEGKSGSATLPTPDGEFNVMVVKGNLETLDLTSNPPTWSGGVTGASGTLTTSVSESGSIEANVSATLIPVKTVENVGSEAIAGPSLTISGSWHC